MQITCSCGEKNSFPDDILPGVSRCTACGNLLGPGVGPAAQRPFSIPVPIILLIAFICLSVVGGGVGTAVFLFSSPPSLDPIDDETYRESNRLLPEVFKAGVVPLGPREGREGEVLEAVRSFVNSVRQRRLNRFAGQMHVKRFLAEVQSEAVTSKLSMRIEYLMYLAQLRVQLMSLARGLGGGGGGWGRFDPLKVRFHRSGGEAEVVGLLHRSDSRDKARLWLINEGDGWKVFDWELLELAYRLSREFRIASEEFQPNAHVARMNTRVNDALYGMHASLSKSGNEESHLRRLDRLKRMTREPQLLAEIEFYRGWVLRSLERTEESIAAYEKALEHDDRMAWALYHLADERHTQGDYEEALRVAERYRAMLGDDAEVSNLMGLCFEELDRTPEAVQAYRTAMAWDPADVNPRHNLGILLLRTGEKEAGAKLLHGVGAGAENSEDYFSFSADALDDAEEHAHLLRLVEDEEKRSPDTPWLHYYRGLALWGLARYGEAEAALRQGLETRAEDEDDTGYLTHLVLTLAHLGKAEEALKLVPGLEEEKGEQEGAYLRAYVLAAGDREEEAVGILSKLLEEDESLHERIAGGRAFQPMLKRADVRKLLERARTKDEFNAKLDGLWEREDWKAIIELCGRTIEAVPGFANAYYFRGVAHRKLEDYAEAERWYREGLRRDDESEHPEYWEDLGYVLAHLGRIPEALKFSKMLASATDWKIAALYLETYIHAVDGDKERTLAALKRYLGAGPALSSLEVMREERAFTSLLSEPEARSAFAAVFEDRKYVKAASTLADDGKWNKLLQLSRDRIQADPRDGDAHFYSGVALEETGKYAEAEGAYRKGLEIDVEEEHPYYWERLGLVLAHLGREGEVSRFVERLIGAEGWEDEGMFVRATAFALSDDEAAAIKALRDLLEKFPDYRSTVVDDRVFRKLRRHPEVKALLEKAKRE